MKRWLVVSLFGAAACGKSDPRPPTSSERSGSASGSAATGSTASGSAASGSSASGSAATAPRPLEPPVAVAAPAGPYRGPDCRAAHAPRPDRDAAPMCFQPGGTFLVGSPEGEGTPAERPQRRVTLSPFFIDQFEVTTAQFARFLAEAPHGLPCDRIGPDHCEGTQIARSPWALDVLEDGKVHDWNGDRFRGGTRTYAVRAREERLAMREVTVEAARAYCAWVGKALPSNARWEYAARVEPLTGKLRVYPWGDQFERAASNCGREDCGDPFSGVAPVDEFPRDVSATGVRGLGGNVAEWVAECAAPAIPDCGACVDPVGPVECTARAIQVEIDGRLTDVVEHGPVARGGDHLGDRSLARAALRPAYGTADPDERVGFRCATDAINAR